MSRLVALVLSIIALLLLIGATHPWTADNAIWFIVSIPIVAVLGALLLELAVGERR